MPARPGRWGSPGPTIEPGTEPAMTSSHQDTPSCQWFSRLVSALDPRSAPRLARLLLGAVLARGRKTVTGWIRAAGLSGQYQLVPLDQPVARGLPADVADEDQPAAGQDVELTQDLDHAPEQGAGRAVVEPPRALAEATVS